MSQKISDALPRREAWNKNGFSLIEVLIAIILTGLAIASLLAANGVFTKAHGAGVNLSTAEFLIEQIKERTALSGYENLHALDGASYCPPISVNGEVLNDFAEFSQEVTVENVSNTDFELVVSDYSSSFVRITVRVLLNGRQISSTNWVRAQY